MWSIVLHIVLPIYLTNGADDDFLGGATVADTYGAGTTGDLAGELLKHNGVAAGVGYGYGVVGVGNMARVGACCSWVSSIK